MLLITLFGSSLLVAVAQQCRDEGGTHNYCTKWCNTPGRWGCGVCNDGNYTCDCTGCNGCGGAPTPAHAPTPATNGSEFLILGDWGWGNSAQKAVAAKMALVAEQHNTDYIVSVGDNIYNTGVTSTSDSQWKTKWADIYAGPLMKLPWFSVLGNHDWLGNAQAQIDRAKVDPIWHMDDLFYLHTVTIGADKLSWLHIETNLIFYGPSGENPTMKAAFAKRGWTTEADVKEHLVLVEKLLQKVQSSKWIFVVGHQINLGKICGGLGNMPALVPLFEKYRVAAYFGGHTHALAFHKSNGISYFLTGGGGQAAGLCGGGVKDWGANAMGFVRGTVSDHTFVAEFWDNNGANLFTTPVQNPR